MRDTSTFTRRWILSSLACGCLALLCALATVGCAQGNLSAGPQPDAKTLQMDTCRPCHAAGRSVDPWDALAIYPDFPPGALSQGGRALEPGYGDLLPLDSTVLEWEAWQARLEGEDEARGRNCINCHLQKEPSPEIPAITRPGGAWGEVEVDPEIAAMHAWLDTPRKEARSESLGVWVDVETYKTLIIATVKVLNYGSGHRLPTGGDGRNITLRVEAHDGEGSPLVFFRGHALPDHVGAPLAGEPGFLYARLFADAEGAVGVSPAKAVRVHSDTRLQGGEHDELHFYFLLPEAAPVDGVAWSVEATLWWRSALGSTADAQMIESAKREHSGH